MLSRARAWVVLLCGIGGYVYLMFPGAFFSDTLGLYEQALKHEYLDWHSPTLAFIWGVLDRWLVSGFGSLLAFNAVTIGVGLFLLLRAAGVSPGWAAVLSPAVMFSPPVFTSTFWLSKDPSALGALLLGMGVMLGPEPSRPRSWMRWVLGALLLTVPGMMRVDYAPLAALVVMGAVFIHPGFLAGRSRRLRVLAVACTGGLFLAGAFSLDSTFKFGVLEARRAFVVQTIMYHDLAAISLHENRLIAPEFLRQQGWDLDYVRKHYTPRAQDPLSWPEGRPAIVLAGELDVHRDFVRLWARTVAGHPGAYLRHRAAVYSHLLDLVQRDVSGLVPSLEWLVGETQAQCTRNPILGSLPAERCIFRAPGALHALISGDRWLLEHVPVLFRPLTYVACCLLGVALALRRLWKGPQGRGPLVLLCTAGLPLVHLGMLFFFAPASDWRYLSLLLTGGVCSAGFVAAALCGALLKRAGRGPQGAALPGRG